MAPTGMAGVGEMGAARILIPIGSHVYIVRYISDDINVKPVTTEAQEGAKTDLETGGHRDLRARRDYPSGTMLRFHPPL